MNDQTAKVASVFRGVLLISWLSFSSCHAPTPAASVAEADHAALMKREVLAAFERGCDLQVSNARVAPPLELMPAPPPGAHPAPLLPGVFLEMALFTAPTSVATAKDVRGALAVAPTARLVAAPHVKLEFDRTVQLPFEEHMGPLAHTTLRAIEGTANLVGDGRLALDLDLALQLPTAPDAERSVNPRETRARFVLGVAAREPVAATAVIPGRTDESAVLLLVAYVVREDADLRTLFECKMRQRQRELERRRD